MDHDRFATSLRKFLREVGVTSQQAVEALVEEGKTEGKLSLKMKLTAEGTTLNHVVESEIDLG